MSALERQLKVTAPVGAVLLAAILLLLVVAPVWADGDPADIDEYAGTFGGAFLKIPIDPKGAAMGEAYSTVTGDVFSLQWNPAGLANVKDFQVAATHIDYVVGVDYEYVGFANTLSNRDAWGASVQYLHMNDITRTIETAGNTYGGTAGTYGASDMALSIGYARNFDENFRIGIAARFIKSEIDNVSATAFVVDAGAQFRTPIPNLTVSAVFQNFGSGLTFINDSADLPRTFKVGAAYDWSKVTAALELIERSDEEAHMAAGLSYTPVEFIVFRVGWRSHQDLGRNAAWSYGVGLRGYGLEIDYAIAPLGDLGDVHRMSLLKHF